MKFFFAALAATAVVLGPSIPAWATLDEAKLYKKALAEAKIPKCATCHKDEKPKKEDGQHELNEYGAKLKAAAEALPDKELTEEAIKAVGPAPTS